MDSGGLSVGIDLVEVDRFARALRRWPRLLERVFTEDEVMSCLESRDAEERLAARFASKEAAFKALGDGWPTIPYPDVEIVSAPNGRPSLRLRGRAAVLARGREAAVSMTHAGGLAIAEVILGARDGA
jgi:holo-[acyl-carrier protein] synthase